MKTYLYVEMFDSWGAHEDAHWTGQSNHSNRRRIVKVELTQKQLNQIKPRYKGMNCGMKMYEEVNVLCIQDENELLPREESPNE